MANSIVAIGKLVKAFAAAGITIEQDTKTGYFNATRMVESWNNFSGQKKRLDVFMKTASTKEYINALNEDLADTTDRWYQGTGKAFETIKGNFVPERQQGTWMHWMLGIELAGWLNVKVKIACNKIIMGEMPGTLIIQAPIYGGRDRKEVIVPHGQIPQITAYNSEDYLRDRKAEFGW